MIKSKNHVFKMLSQATYEDIILVFFNEDERKVIKKMKIMCSRCYHKLHIKILFWYFLTRMNKK